MTQDTDTSRLLALPTTPSRPPALRMRPPVVGMLGRQLLGHKRGDLVHQLIRLP